MTERDLVAAILLEFGARPDLRLWRQNTGAARTRTGALVRFGQAGQSDIMGLLSPSGRFVAIEAKTPTGRQSPEQRKWGEMVTRFGGLYVLARSTDDVRAALEPVTR